MPWMDSVPTGNEAIEIRTYRDTPKRGETDAGWCGYTTNGYMTLRHTSGHATEAEARAALGG